MPLASVTRFRARTLLVMPFFMLHARRAIVQLHRADGYIAGAVRPDGRLTFWTMSVWRDELALVSYVSGGAHRAAMPHLAAWAVEASVARWVQDSHELPDWAEAVTHMRAAGRLSAVERPGPNHADLGFADPQEGRELRL
jgi:hypothetical protein